MSQLQAEALVVHLYLAAAGPEHQKDLEYLYAVWRRCKETFGMTEPIAGLPTDLDNCDGEGLLAALRRPTPQQGRQRRCSRPCCGASTTRCACP